MKRNIILFSAAAILGYITLSSRSGGPAAVASLNVSTSGCAGGGCHDAGSAATAMAITLRDSATGVNAIQYVPGKTYYIEIGGTNSSGMLKWGFQAAVVKVSGGTSVGTLTPEDAVKTHVTTLSGVALMEHSSVITTTAGALVAKFKWKAPASGSATGTIAIRGVLNAVNGTGTEAGDKPSLPISVNYSPDLTAIQETEALINRIYPNPAGSTLSLSLKNITAGDYNFIVCDLFGRQISSEQKTLNSSADLTNINVSGLAQGSYILQVRNNEVTQAVPFVKL